MFRSTMFLILVLGALSGGRSNAQDSLQLHDGRFVSVESITKKPKVYVVHFKNGDVALPEAMVKEALVSKVEGVELEKVTPEAQAKLDQGYVRFENQWIKPDQRDRILDGRRKVRAQRIAEAKAHREWRNRYKTSSPHFSVESTLDPEKSKEFVELLETYYKVFHCLAAQTNSPDSKEKKNPSEPLR